MNQDIIQGKWSQIKSSLKTQWGKLTDDDLARMDGNRHYLIGKLQERYGWQKDQAEQEIRSFEHALDKALNRSKAA
ncbi:MAG: CsbD family protein [Rudaea sp.]